MQLPSPNFHPQSQSTIPLLDPHHETTPSTPPTHQDIAIRAYHIYLQSGSKAGHCSDNWQQAERFLTDEINSTPSPLHDAIRTR